MSDRLSRRDVVRATGKLAAAGLLGMDRAAIARPQPVGPEGGTFSHVDSILRAATLGGDTPGRLRARRLRRAASGLRHAA